MRASIIIAAYNACQTITSCVRALQEQTIPCQEYEIIVVDDDSADETRQAATTAGATVIWRERGRPAAARNTGIQAAKGDILCFTDADCIPTPDWLENMLAPFADPMVMGCKGVYATHQPEVVARFVQLEYEDKYDLMRRQEQIDFVDTYSAAYRREVLTAVGGFDERFDYLEDQELSFRVAAQGHKLVFQPAAVVYHLHSNTFWKYFRKKVLIGYWKAQVTRKFPQHVVRDSHTPQVMKLQMGLMGLLWAGTAVSPFIPFVLWPLLALFLLFLLTTLPFVRKAWRKDPQVALFSPFLLALRATALGLGYAGGIIYR